MFFQSLIKSGRLSWEEACKVAADHGLYADFIADWAPKCCHNYDEGVSAKQFAYWLGY